MKNPGQYDSPLKATLKGIADLFVRKPDDVHLPDNLDLTGKNILMIGASAGLGFAGARRIARANANLIMAVRSGIPEKGDQIVKETGNKNVTMLKIDLLDFESIDNFLEEFRALGIKIDILISNAAMVPLKARKTPQGLEEMFMVNYLSAFYIINQLLIHNLFNQDESKIIITSSESHRNPQQFEWDQFGVFKDYGMGETVARYGYFKLLLTTFANELSRRLEATGTNLNVGIYCPGPVNSNIAREAPGWLQPILKGVFSLFFRSPEKASDPMIYLVATEFTEANIDYLFLMNKKPMDQKATDPENGDRLWDLSSELCTQLNYPLNH